MRIIGSWKEAVRRWSLSCALFVAALACMAPKYLNWAKANHHLDFNPHHHLFLPTFFFYIISSCQHETTLQESIVHFPSLPVLTCWYRRVTIERTSSFAPARWTNRIAWCWSWHSVVAGEFAQGKGTPYACGRGPVWWNNDVGGCSTGELTMPSLQDEAHFF